jgi:hypothetical protein
MGFHQHELVSVACPAKALHSNTRTEPWCCERRRGCGRRCFGCGRTLQALLLVHGRVDGDSEVGDLPTIGSPKSSLTQSCSYSCTRVCKPTAQVSDTLPQMAIQLDTYHTTPLSTQIRSHFSALAIPLVRVGRSVKHACTACCLVLRRVWCHTQSRTTCSHRHITRLSTHILTSWVNEPSLQRILGGQGPDFCISTQACQSVHALVRSHENEKSMKKSQKKCKNLEKSSSRQVNIISVALSAG